MRIPSGVSDQYVYFVAVDATDHATRETGLSSFTVYRSRNGAAAAAMTTPTINETDSTNMPGVYELLLDEDTTIAAGNDSEEMCLHITHAGMAPVTRTIELYRPKITAGNTLGVEADGDLTKVNTLDGHTAQTGDSFARLGAPAGASVSADIATVDTVVDGIQTDLDNGTDGLGAIKAAVDVVDGNVDAILVDTGTTIPAQISGLNDLDAAAVNEQVDAALADIHLDHLLAAAYDPATPPGVSTALLNVLFEDDGGVPRYTANALEQAPSGGGGVADWTASERNEIRHRLGITGTTASPGGTPSLSTQSSVDTVDGVADAIKAVTDNLPNSGALTDLASQASVNTIDGIVDAIKLVTDALPNGGALTDLASQASVDVVDGNVDAILVDTGTTIPALIAALNDISAQDVLTAQLTESYSADGVEPTLAQALYLVLQYLYERTVAGTTVTIKRLDGSTTAATQTLNDDTSPTSVTRSG